MTKTLLACVIAIIAAGAGAARFWTNNMAMFNAILNESVVSTTHMGSLQDPMPAQQPGTCYQPGHCLELMI
jgi:hypothetical protein